MPIESTTPQPTVTLTLTCSVCKHRREFKGFSVLHVLEKIEKDRWVVVADGYPEAGCYCAFCPKPKL